MKKHLLLSATALTLAMACVAHADDAKGKKPAETPKEIKCSVMPDHMVNVKDATDKKMFADYKGNRYFFCCAGCPGAFKKDPAKFAKADHIPTPKDAKKSDKKS